MTALSGEILRLGSYEKHEDRAGYALILFFLNGLIT